MAERLSVLLEGHVVGQLVRGAGRKLSFEYEEAWRSADDAYPLSLSMPLAAARHEHRTVSAYLWGLLPENPVVLDQWAKQFQVSAADPFALLAHHSRPGAFGHVVDHDAIGRQRVRFDRRGRRWDACGGRSAR